MSGKLYCLAEFKAKEGREDELFNALQALEEETHKEKGCIMYTVMKKVPNEFATGTHYGIVFNEIWETEEDFNNHNRSKHIQDFFQENCLNENGPAELWNVNVFR